MDIGQTIINLQNNQDEILHNTLSTQTNKVRQVQQDITTLIDFPKISFFNFSNSKIL